MPAWEGTDSPEAIWDLAAFIRHLPQLTTEELKEMKRIAGEEEMREGHEQMEGMEEQKAERENSQANANKGAPPVRKSGKKPHTHAPGTKPHDDH